MVNLHYLHARWTGSMFQWYEYIAALFVPSIGTTDIMIKVEALTNFTKQALLDRTKVIQALNGEQIQMRKAVIHNRMALDILTAAQGWMLCIHSWLIWQCIDCFRWHEKPGKSNIKWKHSFLDFGSIIDEGRLGKTIFTTVVVVLIVLLCAPSILQYIMNSVTRSLM